MATKTKTKKKKAKVRAKRTARQFLPGMEPVKNDKVHKAAMFYADVRDDRMALTKQEVDAMAVLVDAMEAADLRAYAYGDVSVEMTTKNKVKVRIGGAVETNGEAD